MPPAPPGGQLPGYPATQTPYGYGPQAPYGYAPVAVPAWAMRGPAPGLVYAGFWIRLLAYVIDSVILYVPLVAIALALIAPQLHNVSCSTVNGTLGATYECSGLEFLGTAIPLLSLAGLVLFGVYFSFCWARFGQSLGQRVCGIRVVDVATGGPISGGRAVGRYIGLIIGIWVVYIGVIWAAFDPRKQGWHDKMASTFAVRKSTNT